MLSTPTGDPLTSSSRVPPVQGFPDIRSVRPPVPTAYLDLTRSRVAPVLGLPDRVGSIPLPTGGPPVRGGLPLRSPDSLVIAPPSGKFIITDPSPFPILRGDLGARDGASLSVQGVSYFLAPVTASLSFDLVSLALTYREAAFVLTSSEEGDVQPTFGALCLHMENLRRTFAPSAAESDALRDADGFDWPSGCLDRDAGLLSSLGSISKVLEHHSATRRILGINRYRLTQFLGSDPCLPILIDMAEHGCVIDPDPSFIPLRRTAPFRQLQRRLLPVYKKHAWALWSKGKGVLLRVSDIPPNNLHSLHTANECHWTPKPGKPEGRFLIDCSNLPDGQMPLNGGATKDLGIQRYTKVCLPSLRSVLLSWNEYRASLKVSWAQLRIFKDDVAGCFNKLQWDSTSSHYLATHIDPEVIFIMITCGFGVAITPMAWQMFSAAILRALRAECPCPVDIYVDDVFGVGLPDHATAAVTSIHRLLNGALGPDSVALHKSVLASHAEILGFYIDLMSATIRPRDRAIDKLFFVFYQFDYSVAQPLSLWQCLSSLVTLYSSCLRGMRPFVTSLQHMTRKCSGSRQQAIATPSAQFAIEMWRCASVLLTTNRSAFAVPIEIFLLNPSSPCDFELISDASPWRLAAGIRDPQSKALIAWSTFLLPFAKGNEHRFQTQREYLGHLFSLLLLLTHLQRSIRRHELVSYRWINDNMGALAWASSQRTSSLTSQHACLAVSQLNLLTNVWLMESVYLPGCLMGEIDSMSRKETHESAGESMETVCPSLTLDLFIDLDTPVVRELFTLCDPSVLFPHTPDHHAAFLRIVNLLRSFVSYP